MFQTIQVSSCLSIQGEFVEVLANGDVVIRDGSITYRGQPIKRAKAGFPVVSVQAPDPRAVSASA